MLEFVCRLVCALKYVTKQNLKKYAILDSPTLIDFIDISEYLFFCACLDSGNSKSFGFVL